MLDDLVRCGSREVHLLSCSPCLLLTAAPSRALIDEPIMLEARHLTPHCPVTLRAHMRCDEGDLWEALAHYHADGSGALNREGFYFAILIYRSFHIFIYLFSSYFYVNKNKEL